MEENEDTQSPEDEHVSVTHNSWVTPGENTDSVKTTDSSLTSATKSPINLWTFPMNGKE